MAVDLSDNDYQKAMFAKLLSEGMSSAPVEHWTQGAARMAQALVGGLGIRRDRQDKAAGREWLVQALGGGSPAESKPAGEIPAASSTEVSGASRGVLGGQPVQMAQASPVPSTGGGASQSVPAHILQGIRHPNPYVQQQAIGLAQKYLKPSEYEYKTRDDGSLVAVNKANPSDVRLIQTPGGSQSLIDFAAQKEGATKKAGLQAEKEFKAPERRQAETQRADTVMNAIDRAVNMIDTAKMPTTGAIGGQILSNVGGTSAHDVASLLETVQSNLGFQQLQQMRDASPTGGALGSITERELAMLQAAAGNVRQSQSAEQLKENLARLRKTYSDVIHGPGTPTAAPSQGGARRTRTGVQWSVD